MHKEERQDSGGSWKKQIDIGDYSLCINGTFNQWCGKNGTCVLIGEVIDPLNEGKSAVAILGEVAASSDPVEYMAGMVGRFLLVTEGPQGLLIIPDACAQYECFYTEDYRVIASHVGLIEINYQVEPWSGEPENIYSRIQSTNKIPIGNSTRFKNVKHLLPNHYISLTREKVVRFFPTKEKPLNTSSLDEASEKGAHLLRNIAKGFGAKYELALPLTAGYDSRMLLAAFKQENFRPFIYRHPGMKSDHYDIVTGGKVAQCVDKSLEVISYERKLPDNSKKLVEPLSDDIRKEKLSSLINGNLKHFPTKVILNGNIGEIGRSYYPALEKVDVEFMSLCLGYRNQEFVNNQIREWLKKLDVDALGTDNIMDLFYWEFRMGTWGAKAMTESNRFTKVLSPLNCHRLLTTMLSVEKKYRKPYRNVMFRSMIDKLDPRLNQVPFNPNRKTDVIKAMIDLRVYEIYRRNRVKILM